MKSKTLIAFVIILLLGITIVWWWNARSNAPGPTVDQVSHLVDQEVPPGANVARVNSFLDSHKIEHSNTQYRPELDSDFRDNQKLDGKRDRIKGMLVAITRDVRSHSLVSWSISLNFYFVEQGRLVEYTIREVGTGT